MQIWTRPSLGLFISGYKGEGDKDSKSGNGGIVLGDFIIQLGGLIGSTVGFGKKFGIMTGLDGGIALIPWLAFGFIGLPIGVHFNKRIGIGAIIPIWNIEPLQAFLVGIGLFAFSWFLAKNKKNEWEV
mgnify:FL=1